MKIGILFLEIGGDVYKIPDDPEQPIEGKDEDIILALTEIRKNQTFISVSDIAIAFPNIHFEEVKDV